MSFYMFIPFFYSWGHFTDAGAVCESHHQNDHSEEDFATQAEAGLVHQRTNAKDFELVIVPLTSKIMFEYPVQFLFSPAMPALKCCNCFPLLYLPSNSGPTSRAPWSSVRNLATNVCGRPLAISVKVVSGGFQMTYKSFDMFVGMFPLADVMLPNFKIPTDITC